MSSDATRWRQVRDLFEAVADLSESERAVRLAALHQERPDLAEAVERLLSADAAHSALLDGGSVPRAGDTFGTYTIERELARGGMASVYVAHDARHGRQVAVKVLTRSASSTTSAERFLREVRVASQLQHPNICPLYDSGERDGMLWYAMPFVAGGTLRATMQRDHALSVADTVRIIREIARALQFAHDHGIAHRDVKPENVLLASDGSVLVMDFGIARAFGADSDAALSDDVLTRTGAVLGTPLYMSPEQRSAERGGPAADQYALTLMTWEMLTGRHPFVERTAAGASQLRRGTLPPLTVETGDVNAIEPVLRRALSDHADARYSSVREFVDALDHAARGDDAPRTATDVPVPNTATDPTPHDADTGPERTRRRWMFIGAAVVVVAMIIATWRTSLTTFIAALGKGSEGTARAVVLPFVNQGDAGDANFSIGVSDAVRSQLVASSTLEVIARETSMSFDLTKTKPEDIARQLGVRFIVSGTVQWARDSQRVLVRPSLIEIRDGRAIVRWEEGITAKISDVFAVQDSIARLIRLASNATVAPGRVVIDTSARTNVAAYEAFLAGAAAGQGLAVIDWPSLQKAKAAYIRAIQLDSSYGPAWSHLAVTLGYLLSRVPTPGLADSTRAALATARRLAPNDPNTAMALSLAARYVDGNREASLTAANDGLRRFPRDPILLAQSAILELSLGRPDSALALIERAERFDPRSVAVLWRKANIQLYRRDTRGADATAQRAMALSRGNVQLAEFRMYAAIGEGDLARAQSAMRDAIADPVMNADALYARIAAASGLAWTLMPAARDRVMQLPDSVFEVASSVQWIRADLLWSSGNRDAARREALAALKVPGPQSANLLLLAIAGDTARVRAEAATRVRRIVANYDTQFSPKALLQLAQALGVAGIVDDGRRVLDLMMSRPGPLTRAWIAVDPHFASLR